MDTMRARELVTTEQACVPSELVTTEQACVPGELVTTEQACVPGELVTTEQACVPSELVTTEQAYVPDELVTTEQACVPVELVTTEQARVPDVVVTTDRLTVVEEQVLILPSETSAAEDCEDRQSSCRRYTWDNNCSLPPCKLVLREIVHNCLGHRATWHRVVETVAAIMCAYSTHTLLLCWIENKPSNQSLFFCSLLIMAFIMLNSVEYSVLTHISASIRTQAIFLFAISYTVFFSLTSALFIVHTIQDTTVCGQAEIAFGVVTTLAATIIRFTVPLIQEVCHVNGSSQYTTRARMHTTQLVCLSVVASAFLVAGLSIHLYAILVQPFAAFAMAPYLVSVPLLTCIGRGVQRANPECVWSMWSWFTYVYSCVLTVSLPACFYQAGLVTYQVEMLSTTAVFCTGVGLTLFSWCCVPVYDGGHRRHSTLDYMYTY
jgi:hypothetical protein